MTPLLKKGEMLEYLTLRIILRIRRPSKAMPILGKDKDSSDAIAVESSLLLNFPRIYFSLGQIQLPRIASVSVILSYTFAFNNRLFRANNGGIDLPLVLLVWGIFSIRIFESIDLLSLTRHLT